MTEIKTPDVQGNLHALFKIGDSLAPHAHM